MNLIFNDDFMQNAIKRINELQEETIQESKKIKGIEPYIKKRLELFDKDEKIREELKANKLPRPKGAKVLLQFQV